MDPFNMEVKSINRPGLRRKSVRDLLSAGGVQKRRRRKGNNGDNRVLPENGRHAYKKIIYSILKNGMRIGESLFIVNRMLLEASRVQV